MAPRTHDHGISLDQAKQLVLTNPVGEIDRHHLWLAAGERAGLVEHDRVQ